MSINKHFLVATNTWQELVSPGDRDIFICNESGKTVHFYLSPNKLEEPIDITSEYLALGGNISQSVVRANQYLYVRAMCEPTESVVLIADTNRISVVEGVELREELEGIASQLMALTNRVTDNELRHTDNNVRWTKFLSEYRERVLEGHNRYVTLSDMLVDLLTRIQRAEIAGAKNTDKIFNMEVNTFPDIQNNLEDLNARHTALDKRVTVNETKHAENEARWAEFSEEYAERVRNDDARHAALVGRVTTNENKLAENDAHWTEFETAYNERVRNDDARHADLNKRVTVNTTKHTENEARWAEFSAAYDERVQNDDARYTALDRRVTSNETKLTGNDGMWDEFLNEYRARVLEGHDRFVTLSDTLVDLLTRIQRAETAGAKNTDKIFNMEVNTFPDIQNNIREVSKRSLSNTARIEQLEASSQ